MHSELPGRTLSSLQLQCFADSQKLRVDVIIAQITIEEPKPTERKGAFLEADKTQAQNTSGLGCSQAMGKLGRCCVADVLLGDNLPVVLQQGIITESQTGLG